MTIVRPASLVDRLRRFFDDGPERTAIASAGLGDPAQLTRGEWDRRARAIAARLRPATRVLVLLPSGIEFYVAFAGALYAGACAVPVMPPVEGRARFVDLALDADVEAVITSSAIAATARTMWAESGARPVRWVELDCPDLAADDSWSPPDIGGDDLALLQYTSGSTGDPKGVAVSHRVLMGWLDVWAERVRLPAGSSVVTWVPAHHVLGLSFVLMAPVLDGQATLLTPADVMADPRRWLRAVSTAAAPVLSGAPPFGYQHCVDAVSPEDRLGLDLSGWEVAVIGSERIRGQVLDDFAEAYASTGFRRSAFFTGYGTSETMMAAAHRGPTEALRLTVDAAELERRRVRPSEEAEARTVELVACGQAGDGHEMIIVEPESRTMCDTGRLGELWIRGPAIAEGYWRRPEQTEHTFHARLADGSGPYLRTGDLAFFHEGELVPCGRLSEMIIIRGRNLVPHDIESTVRSTDPVLTDVPVAAFSVDDAHGEQLVVIVAVDRDEGGDPEPLLAQVRRAIVAAHEVQPHAVHFVAPGWIPLTMTGKVQHSACRQAYVDGRLETTDSVIAESTQPIARGELENAGGSRHVAHMVVRDRIGALIGEPGAGLPAGSPLIQLGLDSMDLIKLRAGLVADLGVVIPMEQLAGHTVSTLADRLADAPGSEVPQAVEPARATADPDNRHEPFGLTELQHAYLVGRSGGYTLGGVGTHFYAEYDSAGLDLHRLHAAWVRLVERHDMLRAVVSSDGDQRVQPSVDVPPFPEQDLRGVDHEQASTGSDRTRAEMSHHVFAPDSWPLFDVRVSRLPGGLDRIHVSLDLLVLDVWSLHVLSREWRQLYQEPDGELPSLAVTFRDYVVAAQRQAGSAASERAERYWLDRLDSLPGGPELPLRCSPAALTHPPGFVRRKARLDEPRWTRMNELATAAGLTTSSVLLAAYAVVLGAWNRRARFTLNLPTFNRRPLHDDIDTVIGDFTSVTLLEVDLGETTSIVDLAVRLQTTLWRDLEHRDFNGVRVLRELARRRGPDTGVLAPVVFSSASGQSTGGAQEMPLAWLGEPAFGISQTPQVLIDNQLIETFGGLDFNWDTVDELFADGTVDEMFTAYRGLLEHLADGADDVLLEQLPVLLPAAQSELIAHANETSGDVPSGTLFDALVGQARATPDRVAVVTDDVELTFGQLHRHACALAHELELAHVERNQPVAVSVPKGAEQVIAVLGVLLAGGAYLPVDPELPLARQDRLFELGGCRVVVCGQETPRASWPENLTRIVVDVSGEPDEHTPRSVVDQEDLAYVIFTSGSTGEPKGVAVSHRAALNTCVDVCERFDVGPDDRVLGLSSLSFDLSVWDIFGVLGAGGAIVLPAAQDRRDPARWLELVRRHRVTIWNSVPALAQMFADYAGGRTDAQSLSLRLALLSGDWIPVDLPARIRAVVPGCRVVSLGGATEAGIWSICYEIDVVDPSWESIPYGSPMRNQRFSVLNDRWQECPVHVVGELFIGGVGLAEGYFADTERTAAAFVTHPETGERLYRTGDLGRWRPDATIEFLGREDFQVKVGGYRIELGEIEAAIAEHPGVRSAVVTAMGDRHHRRLAACVVAETGPEQGPRSAVAVAPEFYTVADRKCMIFDELERVDFKLARHGVRTGLTGDPVALAGYTDGSIPDRTSHRRYADRPVPIAELAGLLDRLRSHDGPVMPKFAYASAGNSYAVQTYLYVADGKVDGLAGGTYYHDPAEHQLVPVRGGATLSEAVRFGADQHSLDTAAFALFFVAAMDAVRPLYGSRSARELCLIETGLMAQSLEDDAAGNHLGLCQLAVVGGEESLRESFRLTGDHEVLHAMIGGPLLRAGEKPLDLADQRSADEASLLVAVRRHLACRLPDYMVPAQIVVTKQLPLTPTGKVDRGALEQLVAVGKRDVDTSRPAGELETRIAEVFQQVLEIDVIGVHARFFDVGADSTVIVRAYRLLKAKIERDFPLTAMFEHGSVRELATALSSTGTGERDELLATAQRRAGRARAARSRGRTRSEPLNQEGNR